MRRTGVAPVSETQETPVLRGRVAAVNSRPSVSEIYEDGDRRDACPTGQTRTRDITFDCIDTLACSCSGTLKRELQLYAKPRFFRTCTVERDLLSV
jgi:hypothetical protein